jgi:lauroyl/myristoyl acyltransferase
MKIRVLGIAGALLSGLVLVLPRRHRFAALAIIARLFLPVIRRSHLLGNLRVWHVNTDCDLALYALLQKLDRHDFGRGAEIRFDGIHLLDAAAEAGSGTLIVAPHALLLFLAVRRLHDTRGNVTAVRAPAPGGRAHRHSRVPVIVRSPEFMLDVRDALGAGRTVFAMVDRRGPEDGVTTTISTASGTVHLSVALIRLAVRCGASVIFMTARPHLAGLSCTIAAPSRDSVGDPDAIVAELGRFVQAHAQRRR